MLGGRVLPSIRLPICGLLVNLLMVFPARPVAAQVLPEGHGERIYRAVRVDTPPVIDGDLADPIWQQAEVIADLVQQVPDHGAQPSERTEARILYDDDALYLSFYAYESDPSARTRTMAAEVRVPFRVSRIREIALGGLL